MTVEFVDRHRDVFGVETINGLPGSPRPPSGREEQTSLTWGFVVGQAVSWAQAGIEPATEGL